MPLLGSVAVYLGILAALGFSQLVDSLEREVLIVFFTGTFLLIIGILDDWGILHPQIKLIVAMPVPSYGTITNSFLHFLSEGEISSTS